MSVSESSKICAQAFETGFFGPYGGQFVPESLKKVLDEVNEAFVTYKDDPDFKAELAGLFTHYCGRPSPIFHLSKLSRHMSNSQI